jgi:hypothetical protein
MRKSFNSIIYNWLLIGFVFLVSSQIHVGPGVSAVPATIGERIFVDMDAYHPRALHAFGKWHVSWLDTDPTVTSRLRQYNAAGLVGTEVSNSCILGTNADPAVAAGNDHILQVYTVNQPGTQNSYLVAVLYDSDGNQLDREYIVSHGHPYTSIHAPAIANEPGTNEFMIVYREWQGSFSHGVWGLLAHTGSGQIVVAGGPVEYSGSGEDELDIAYGSYHVGGGLYMGLYFAVWKSFWGIYGQAIWPGSASAWGETISFPTNGDPVAHPAIASGQSDGETPMIVTWGRGAATMNVVAQRIRPNGELIGSVFTVASGGMWPDVVASDTEYLIACHESPEQSYQDRIFGRYYDFNGNALSEIFTIVDDDELTSNASLASDGVNYFVAYQTIPWGGQINLACQRVGPGAFTFVDGAVSFSSTNSRGVAWGDWYPHPYGLPDLFIGNEGAELNRAYENEGDGVFGNSGFPANEAIGGQGIAWADFDNDGDLDLYVSNGSGPNELYRREGGGAYQYQAVGADLGVDDPGASRSVAWGDYDADGLLDLYVGNMDSANRLYHNDGDGFTEVGVALGVDDIGPCEGVAFVDFDNDRDLDICVGNAGWDNLLYENLGGTFAEVGTAWNMSDSGPARSVSWCDYDNDGDFDVYVSNYNYTDELYRNTGTTFQVISSSGLNDAGPGESACWADYDLDGDQDLFLAKYMDTDRLFRNTGGIFTDVGTIAGLDDDGRGLGAAWADMDDDGDPDLCVTSYGGQNRIYRNDLNNGNNWLKVSLEGVTTNVSAIGARVRVVASTLVQTQDVGGRNGYLSQNDLTLIFGLGDQAVVDSVVVRWSGGGLDIFTNVSPSQILQISEGSSTTAVSDRPTSALRLLGGRPNPFNPRTQIHFELPGTETIDLAVFDTRGRRVGSLAQGTWPAGRHSVSWDGRDKHGRALASGVYLVRLMGEQAAEVQSVTLVR